MSYFGLNPSQENDLVDRAMRTPGTGPTPGVFSGSLTAIPEGIASGALKTVAPIVAETTDENFNPLLSAMSPTPFAIPEAPPAPELSPEEWGKQRRAAVASTLAVFKPDPKTTGFVGQLLHGVADVGSRFLAGAAIGGPVGGAALAGGTEGYAVSTELQSQGVDPQTAATAGAVQGVAVGLGGLLPAGVGGSLLARIGTGAAGNVAIGSVSRGATSAVLADAGYAKQAEQYKWLDAQAVAIDLVLGAGFGGLSHVTRARPSEVDAALTGNEALHIETATAPGVPTTTAARSAHVSNQTRAAEALYADEPVTGLADVELVRNPQTEAVRAEVRTALDETYPDAVVAPRVEQRVNTELRARIDAMSPAERDAELAYLRVENDRMRNELGTDPLTGLGNRRAFDAAEPAPLQVMMDVDSLKYVNDTMGHQAGDAYLQAVGEAMRRAEVPQGYRLGGDEFAFQARTEAEATAIRERIDRELQGVTVEAILPDGTVMTKTGVGVSYGVGRSRAEADAALYANKAERTAAGQRGERGAEPPGISRRPAARDAGTVPDAPAGRTGGQG
ncbi:MAG TPA: GGDEF domain-containing protein, partial [Tahibacter sp.]|nr:GGDEF domain-containing protein [Tahibacter sp.]